MDPVYIALAGAISTLAGFLYRSMEQRAKRAEDAELFWRDKALMYAGLAEVAADDAERRKR